MTFARVGGEEFTILFRAAERIFGDETTLPTLAPGSGSAKTAWLWAYARDDRPFGGSGAPMVAYRFEDSRAGDRVARHLSGYRGILQVDGYGAYNKLARSDGGNDGMIHQTQVLRAPHFGPLQDRHRDGGVDGKALAGRRNGPRPKP
jgi:hypothetical protein